MKQSSKNKPMNPQSWGVKIKERTKNRMKIQLKLNQEESEAFTNFANNAKPEHISLDDFIRSIFFAGVRVVEEQLTANLVAHMEANREEFEKQGFTFDENGKLTGVAEDSEIPDVEIVE